ncbi:phenoloxidase subunit 1 isoform X2 [Manduca sexta]|uniref:phenoloxidase subunit 1 isoform X2 n=1 Tax=Manduca sexta TaxID=7130 RepID=UPI0011825CD2|nr:phenoloxidase subunit 1 isoform X2 [Manduca sexta]
MTDAKNNLLYFFDRPNEPCFMQKGEDKVVFEIPDHYYPDKYKSLSNTLSNRFGNEATKRIPIRNITLPNLEVPMQLPYNDQFSLFVPKHRTMAAKLIDIFMGMRDVEDLQSVCSYCQLRINPYMFNYCLSVAILHRPDTKGLSIPTFAETFPDKFMDSKVFLRAREVSNVVISGSRMPVNVPINYTANTTEPEQRVAYFREDIGINLHHWHWHLVYPFDSADRSIVNKDRRGELFYYMHQQIIGRYNVERMCNGLPQVKPFSDFSAPIEEGYFPKLDSQVASRTWPPRFAGSVFRNLDRTVDQVKIDVRKLFTWRDQFLEAIQKMAIKMPNGRELPLDEVTGIDMLGNLMESSIISPNRGYYGDLHNMGHVFAAYTHDPDHRHLEQFGVMGDSATAMRDPFFYRWHRFVDDVFNIYKEKLTPYSNERLDFPGVRVSSVGIEGARPNTLRTLWQQSTVELGRGLDFTPRGSVLARFTHLQHDEFQYVIEVNNTTGGNLMGTVRIFMAPKVDDNGQPMSFNKQRRLMIELDKFSQALRPGTNTIRRRSVDSSVTIPYERTFRNQSERPGDPGTAGAAEFDFCGCGWPHHMLIPKGTAQGYPVVLFVMISNWNNDRIEQDLVGSCNDAASYCGIRDRKYPDKQAMGYPFDRKMANDAATLSDFLRPNMAVRDCSIQFSDTTVERGQQGLVQTDRRERSCGCKDLTADEIDALIRKPYYYTKCNHKHHIF